MGIESIITSSPTFHTCTLACRLRYQRLSYECFETHQHNDAWHLMKNACDELDQVRFEPPQKTRSPGTNEPDQATSKTTRHLSTAAMVVLLSRFFGWAAGA